MMTLFIYLNRMCAAYNAQSLATGERCSKHRCVHLASKLWGQI